MILSTKLTKVVSDDCACLLCLELCSHHSSTLELLGAVEMRWIDTYFPFTDPSFELEIYFQVWVLPSHELDFGEITVYS